MDTAPRADIGGESPRAASDDESSGSIIMAFDPEVFVPEECIAITFTEPVYDGSFENWMWLQRMQPVFDIARARAIGF